ncbi:hypothetical protein [Parabacteroides sp. PF5-6]|uniref:exodeoxyribonuclease X C-terminal domain-containing protein n=1 Tax=Parabacteroides sp. PF5-6 TaxID=1742403 RepID=UPI002404C0C4|nr:hypothetical protein [Parabacteroides sp. PF5-6]MDF9828915.1 hypothetical protein [Parabacteroides sp. PF5-6]
MEFNAPDITIEVYQLVQDRLRMFNEGRALDGGIYFVLLPTTKTPYYTLWFQDKAAIHYPYLLLSDLELHILSSIEKAIRLIQNSFLPLHLTNSIQPFVENGDDIIPFGKYRGKHLQDICVIDPRYVAWIADKYEPKVKSEFRFKELAVSYSKVYQDLNTPRKYKTSASRFVGKPGDKIKNLNLQITRVRIEDDSYKTHITGGTAYFYVDQLLTGMDVQGNFYLFTSKATDRSLMSRTLSPGTHAYRVGEKITIESAKILKHVEFHNTQYTKLGYLKVFF